jgi:hypothetical protein
LLIEASDAGADGRAKLAQRIHPGVEIWAPLTGEALGRAIGRDHAVHVAVAPGGLALRLKAALRRHQGFSITPAGRRPQAQDAGAPHDDFRLTDLKKI